MKLLRALRALARVEMRQLRQHPGRSFLIMLLVAIPVAAIAGGAILARIREPTMEEQRTREMGQATLRIETPADRDEAARLRSLLPAGPRQTRLFRGRERVRIPGRQLDATLVALEAGAMNSGGPATGMLHLLKGRAPVNSGEVALSPVLMEGLGVSVGDTVTLAYGPRRLITGLVIDPENIDQPVVLRTPAHVEHEGAGAILMELPPADADRTARQLKAAGFRAGTRAEAAAGQGLLAAIIVILGGIGFFEAALVIAAAFAVSLRRRQYEIGLLGSTGATANTIAASLIVSAMVLALLGGCLGLLVGTGTAALCHPYLDGLNHRRNGSFEVPSGLLVLALIMGLVAGALAAAVPAWNASRISIGHALAGQRPSATHSRAWPIWGIGMAVLGVSLLQLMRMKLPFGSGIGVIAGPILVILGFGIMSPWLLETFARVAAVLPLSWRLAVRDAGRSSGRNGPVVTAVLCGMSLCVAVAVLVSSIESTLDAFPSAYRRDQLLVEGPGASDASRRIVQELSGLAAAPLAAVYSHGDPIRARFDGTPPRFKREWVATGGDDLLRAMGLEAHVEAFRSGQLLVLDPPANSASLALTTWRGGRQLERPPIDGVPIDQFISEPLFLLHEDGLEARGMEAGPPLNRSLVPWLVRLPASITPSTLDRARAMAARFPGVTIDAELLHQRPARAYYHAALAICVLTALLVILVATSLAAAESAGDEQILHSVGAAPDLLRIHRGIRAAYLALLGCLLAVPAGLVTVLALVVGANFPLPLVFPWRDLAITLIGLPATAFVGGWLLGGRGGTPAAVRDTGGWFVGLRMIGIGTLLAGALLAGAPFGVTSARADDIRWEPWIGTAFDGSPLVGELGRLTVPENRTKPGGHTIELAFVRYRTTCPNPGPPIFYLAGGPGGSDVELAGRQATHPQLRLLEQRDVIGLDQRGTGISRPNLVSFPEFIHQLPLDRAITNDEVMAGYEEATRRCLSYWTREGIDLTAYNSVESADDIDDVRRAMGLESMALFGSSYGSHLGLACLRRHGKTIERAILMNVEGPDQTWKLPGAVQRQLQQLHEAVDHDPKVSEAIPDVIQLLQQLRTQLAREPVSALLATTSAVGNRIVLGRLDLDNFLVESMASAADLAGVPAALHQFAAGHWSILAESAMTNRRLVVEAMPLMMDCASGASTARRKQMAAERRDPANILGEAILDLTDPRICRAAGNPDLGDDYRGPIVSDVPVLFVSGTLDVRTPPENVEEIRAGFRHGAHLVVQNAAHDGRELMSPEYRDLLQAFLRGERVADAVIRLPAVRFKAIESLPAP